MNKFIVILLFFCFNIYCQKNTNPKENDSLKAEKLEEVILTATRTERQLSSIPLPVTLISGSTIKKSGSVRIDDILAEQTGLILATDESGFEGIQIQGIDSDYTLILMDGVPLVGRSSGNFDLSRLTVGNIKQIEVVKGPTSSLYGSEALAGVINIITEKPKNEKLTGRASYRIGSFTAQDMNLSLQQKKGKIRYALFGNRFSRDKYVLEPNDSDRSITVNPIENYTLNGKFYYDINNNIKLSASGRYFDQLQNSGFSFTDTDGDGQEIIVNAEGEALERDLNTLLKLDQNWSEKFNTTYEFYYTNYIAEDISRDTETSDIVFNNLFDQKLLRAEIRGNNIIKGMGTITTGVGYQYDFLDRTLFENEVSFNSQYVYTQFDMIPLENLNIIIGVRFDNHSEYSNQVSPKFAFNYKITDQLSIKGSTGYGFKAPDFRQLYLNFTNPSVGYSVLGYKTVPKELQLLFDQGQLAFGDNLTPDQGQARVNELIATFDNDLEAESSIGYNIGLNYRQSKKLILDINFFRNDFRNLIDTFVLARKTNGQNVFSYQNFDEIYTEGIEFSATYNIFENLEISGGYQLLYAFNKDIKKQVENGELFVRDENLTSIVLSKDDHYGFFNRSRHNGNLKVFWDIKKWDLNVNARAIYRSKYGLGDTNGNGTFDTFDDDAVVVDGFATLNIAASKKLFKKFEIQAGADNILNYQNINIPGNPGTRGYVRVNYQF
ncbi:outer membrane receptor for ferrienterochelin and colicins [Aquimarina amphilecti]|uniref:Outer membrane receptor for ferrienterochelin and colicins n=1 Tax=Aquimarina amphilecti TaxID=1038014 RepID=A0A1H7PN11_AQUAM|nr:TonB-dependent receptor [Aquimarina amphilecti]SEL36447.1 outer membrane receptor for ferrienterochelin and colicins [Aquimarina amphilecti]